MYIACDHLHSQCVMPAARSHDARITQLNFLCTALLLLHLIYSIRCVWCIWPCTSLLHALDSMCFSDLQVYCNVSAGSIHLTWWHKTYHADRVHSHHGSHLHAVHPTSHLPQSVVSCCRPSLPCFHAEKHQHQRKTFAIQRSGREPPKAAAQSHACTQTHACESMINCC